MINNLLLPHFIYERVLLNKLIIIAHPPNLNTHYCKCNCKNADVKTTNCIIATSILSIANFFILWRFTRGNPKRDELNAQVCEGRSLNRHKICRSNLLPPINLFSVSPHDKFWIRVCWAGESPLLRSNPSCTLRLPISKPPGNPKSPTVQRWLSIQIWNRNCSSRARWLLGAAWCCAFSWACPVLLSSPPSPLTRKCWFLNW